MMFVLGIVAVVASLTIPMAQSVVAMYRLDTSSTRIASKIVEARSEALKRNRPVWLRLDIAARSARIQTTGAGGATLDIGGPEFLPGTIAYAGIAGASVDVTFDATGRLVNPPQVVGLQSLRLGTQRSVTVVVTGRIRVR
jgi:hypothetical protein